MAKQMRAFRFALDPTPTQLEQLNQHAGTARWAFNHAMGVKYAAWQRQQEIAADLMATGTDEKQARRQARDASPIPQKPAIRKDLNRIKGHSLDKPVPSEMLGPHRPCSWHWQVSTYAFQSAFDDADTAWKNWWNSLTGKRAGARMGAPRFKKKGRCRDSFRIHHDASKPTIRPDGYRRLRVPALGHLRLHGTSKPMTRLITQGRARITSVTIARGGHRWYASVLCEVHQPQVAATRAQRARGRVGIDLGVHHLAALSQPLNPTDPTTRFIANPRHANRDRDRLIRAQRAFARTTKGSQRRVKAARRIGRLQHQTAERRATALHTLTKRVATGFAEIAIEDLNVKGMTASARGTRENPGKNVRQKAGLNRSLQDAALGELRRQLTYKTDRYGARLALARRWDPTSQLCSACEVQKPSLTLAERTFTCPDCGLVVDRDLNAAHNIARLAKPVASGMGETPKTPLEGAQVPPPTRPETAGQAEGSPRRYGKTWPTPGHPEGAIPRPPTRTATPVGHPRNVPAPQVNREQSA